MHSHDEQNSCEKFTRVAGKTSAVLIQSNYRHLDRELTIKTRARDQDFPRGNFKKHAFGFCRAAQLVSFEKWRNGGYGCCVSSLGSTQSC